MSTKRPNWIPVVAGFIRKDDLVLVGKRPEKNSLPQKWEFPGGKIELNESPEIALKRELNEELGIEAEIGELKISCTHTFDDVGIIILFYEVKYFKGEPKPHHHMQIKWVEPDALNDLDIPDSNRKILPRLLEHLKE